MPRRASSRESKRRTVNLTIRNDVIETAKALGLNASKAAEAGICEAIRQAQAERWLAENRGALDAHNERIAKSGPLLTPNWAADK